MISLIAMAKMQTAPITPILAQRANVTLTTFANQMESEEAAAIRIR
jgi:hypothetical protein